MKYYKSLLHPKRIECNYHIFSYVYWRFFYVHAYMEAEKICGFNIDFKRIIQIKKDKISGCETVLRFGKIEKYIGWGISSIWEEQV